MILFKKDVILAYLKKEYFGTLAETESIIEDHFVPYPNRHLDSMVNLS